VLVAGFSLFVIPFYSSTVPEAFTHLSAAAHRHTVSQRSGLMSYSEAKLKFFGGDLTLVPS